MQASVIAVHMPVGIPALHTSAVGFNPYLLRRHALGSIRAELKCFKPCHTHERPRLSLVPCFSLVQSQTRPLWGSGS